MLRQKEIRLQNSSKRSTLDRILWIFENYLPQKKRKVIKINSVYKFLGSNLSYKGKIFSNMSPKNSFMNSKKGKVSITLGKWALPYLRLIKEFIR